MYVKKNSMPVHEPAFEEDTERRHPMYRFAMRTLSEQEIVPPHYHSDLEIVVFSKACGHTVVEGTVHKFDGDCVQFIPPNAVHSFYILKNNPLAKAHVLFVNIFFFRQVLEQVHALAPQTFMHQIATIPFTNSSAEVKIRSIVNNFLASKQQGVSWDNVEDILRDMGLLVQLLSVLIVHPETKPQRSIIDSRMRKIMDVINELAYSTVSLTDIARECGFSKFHLCRIFKSASGMTIQTCIIQMRIRRAKYLLSNDWNSITKTCLDCGFSSLSYFITVFKRQEGKTPKQWALDQKKKSGLTNASFHP